jgi:CII-binding regulator of phage lambda lysogenization HflD
MIDYQYENGNRRFFLFCDIDNMKVKGKITQAMAEKAVEDYMTYNYKDVVAKEVRRIGLDGKKAYKNTEEASRRIKAKLLKDYFATN